VSAWAMYRTKESSNKVIDLHKSIQSIPVINRIANATRQSTNAVIVVLQKFCYM